MVRRVLFGLGLRRALPILLLLLPQKLQLGAGTHVLELGAKVIQRGGGGFGCRAAFDGRGR